MATEKRGPLLYACFPIPANLMSVALLLLLSGEHAYRKGRPREGFVPQDPTESFPNEDVRGGR